MKCGEVCRYFCVRVFVGRWRTKRSSFTPFSPKIEPAVRQLCLQRGLTLRKAQINVFGQVAVSSILCIVHCTSYIVHCVSCIACHALCIVHYSSWICNRASGALGLTACSTRPAIGRMAEYYKYCNGVQSDLCSVRYKTRFIALAQSAY